MKEFRFNRRINGQINEHSSISVHNEGDIK